jgi:hypothetical protein
MTQLNKQISHLAVIACILFLVGSGLSEDKLSVIVTKASQPSAAAALCQGSAEIPNMALHNLKINGKGDIRAMAVPQQGHLPTITRQEYEHAKGTNIRDLSQLQFKDGFLYGLNQAGETLLLFPQERKPEKNAQAPLAEIYNVMVEGQLPGKSKEKRSVNLTAIQKIFNLKPNDLVEAALFQHAAQENNAATWKGYLSLAHDYKLAEAMSGLQGALFTCVNDSLQSYASGNYSALKDARTAAMEAKGVEDSQASQELLAKVEAEEKAVSDSIAQANSLLQSGQWDESLASLEPLKKFLGQLKELDAVYSAANDKSYELHLRKGGEKLKSDDFAEALLQYETALARKPDSTDAMSGRKEAVIRKALVDSAKLLQQKQPAKAREQLLALATSDQSLTQDPRFAGELKIASCDMAGQLFQDAQKLLLLPATKKLKPLTTTLNEKAFITGAEKLGTAESVCPGKAGSMLSQVRGQLAEFHLQQARKARTHSAFAATLLYSQAVLRYAPENQEARALAEQAAKVATEKAQVRIGVIFHDASGQCAQDAAQLAQTLQAHLSTYYSLLDEQEAQALYATPQHQRRPNHLLVFGQINSCSIQRSEQQQPVSSHYVVANPAFQDIKNAEQNAEQQYRSCRSTYGEANCAQMRNNLESIKAQRRNTQEWLKYDYSYNAQTVSLFGKTSASVQIIGGMPPRGVAPAGDEVRDTCSEMVGMRDDDETKVGMLGIITGGVQQFASRNSQGHCPLAPDEQYKAQMLQKIEQNLKMSIPSQLLTIPNDYLRRAHQLSDAEEAIENYSLFLLSNANRDSAGTQDAMNFIRQHDPDLHPELLAQNTSVAGKD